MDKKQYEALSIEVIEFDSEDVITTSPGDDQEGEV